MSVEPSEFASKLKRQGSNLCFPLGKSLGVALSRFGFREDQEVLVRFAPQRLEIRARSVPREIQRKSKETAEELKEIEARVRTWMEELPPITDEELEGPPTLEGELLGTLECLLCDDLRPAIEKLESVSQLEAPEPAAAPRPRRKRGRASKPRAPRKKGLR